MQHLLELRSPGGWWSDVHNVNGSPAALYSIMLRTTGEIARPGAEHDEMCLLRHMITQTSPDGGFYKYAGSPPSKPVTRLALTALRMALGRVQSRHWPTTWLARNRTIDEVLSRDIAVTIHRAERFLRSGKERTSVAFEWDLRPLEMLLIAYVDQDRYFPPVPILDPEIWVAVEAIPALKRQVNTLTRKCLPAVSILYRRLRSRNHLSHHLLGILEQFGAFRGRQKQAIQHLVAIIRAEQNENGGWFYNALFTILNIMALREAGAMLDDPAVRRALAYLRSSIMPTAGGIFLNPMNTDIWDTCLAAYSYLNIRGHTVMDDAIRPAIDFLLRWQCDNGGFAWGSASRNDPDNDCTGLVLWVLSLAEQTADHPLKESIAHARARGCALLLQRQDSRGGFSVWENTFVNARPGSQGLIKQCLFDVATPDVTSRVMRALSCQGLGAGDAPIRRAITFLLRTQCRNGAWWSRWWAGYIPGSSFVTLALGEIGLRYGRNDDRSDPLLHRARDALRRTIGFLVRCQNPDGGWGETVQADINYKHAGVGTSTPQYTALAVTALLHAGYPASDAVIRRAIEYLLDVRTSDGRYPDDPPAFTFVAGASYYQYSLHRYVLPLWAFNEYLRVCTRATRRLARQIVT